MRGWGGGERRKANITELVGLGVGRMDYLDHTVEHRVDKLAEDAAVLQHARQVVPGKLATQHTLNPIPALKLCIVLSEIHVVYGERREQTLRRAIWMSKIWMRVLVGRRSRRRFMSWTSPVSALVTSGSIASISACDIFVFGCCFVLSWYCRTQNEVRKKTECVLSEGKEMIQSEKEKRNKKTTEVSVFFCVAFAFCKVD